MASKKRMERLNGYHAHQILDDAEAAYSQAMKLFCTRQWVHKSLVGSDVAVLLDTLVSIADALDMLESKFYDITYDTETTQVDEMPVAYIVKAYVRAVDEYDRVEALMVEATAFEMPTPKIEKLPDVVRWGRGRMPDEASERFKVQGLLRKLYLARVATLWASVLSARARCEAVFNNREEPEFSAALALSSQPDNQEGVNENE